MGLREFWRKLTSGDSVDRELEEVRDHPDDAPHKVEDYEGIKEDTRIAQEFYPGTERLSDDHL
jgi:hypothetical protein